MGGLSIWHWLIVLVVVVLIFGTKKLRNIGQDLGGAVKGFKEGMKSSDEAAAEAPPPPALATTSKAAPPAVVAAALPLAKLAAVRPAIAPSPPVAPAALARAGAALTSDHGADALPTGEGAHAGGLTSPAGTSAEPAPPP